MQFFAQHVEVIPVRGVQKTHGLLGTPNLHAVALLQRGKVRLRVEIGGGRARIDYANVDAAVVIEHDGPVG